MLWSTISTRRGSPLRLPVVVMSITPPFSRAWAILASISLCQPLCLDVYSRASAAWGTRPPWG